MSPFTRSATTRREAIMLAGLGTLTLSASGLTVLNEVLESAANGQSSLSPLNRFPRMVQEFMIRKVRNIEEAANKARAEIDSKEKALAYVSSVQKRIDTSMGPWPKRTPLNARITGIVERDTYTIEKIIFESRPGFLVTGNLYLPKGNKKPRPGVIGVCGHSTNGKAAESYQSFSQGLARLGYVCFIIDPIGQGERSIYEDAHDDHFKETVKRGVHQHLVAGNQQFLVGEFLGSWRCWDAIRALDYLLTRPEVDPKHVGITGNSGGGTQTTWLCGVERRWTMGAPACFVTTFSRNLQNELPADTEQCPPKAIALGLDHSDFLAAMAPKPVVILAKERDFFDVRGAHTAYARLKALYTQLGEPDNIKLFVGPTDHGYSQENREAMYRFFNGVTGISSAKTEPTITIEKDETLYCAPQGKVAALSSKTVFQFTKQKANALEERRKALSKEGLLSVSKRVLNLPKNPSPTPEFNILRDQRSRSFPRKYFTTYTVETEPGVRAIVYRLADERHRSRPPKTQGKKTILYVSHQSSDSELRANKSLIELIKAHPNNEVFTVDLRGIGESRPDTANPDSYLSPYGSDYLYAIHGIMLNRPYPGQRTHDLLQVLQFLKNHGADEISIYANGWGTIPATFAALHNESVSSLTLQDNLDSFHGLATTEHYKWPLSSMVSGVLRYFDLPDCRKAIASRGTEIRII